MQVWSIIVAAGAGTRFGGPKQYETLGDQRVLDWSFDLLGPASTGIVLVVAPERMSEPEPRATVVAAGGATRVESVEAGLRRVPTEADAVVVHDAARPLATPALLEALLTTLASSGADGVVPGLPVVDTVKELDGPILDDDVDDVLGTVARTLDRSRLVAVQTPQVFRAATLRRAHAAGHDGTDDASLVEAIGGSVVVCAGEAANLKITSPEDLERMRRRITDPGGPTPTPTGAP